MQSCEFVMSISALACAISKDKTPDVLALLGALFNQLGDSLSTIAAHEAFCSSKNTPI